MRKAERCGNASTPAALSGKNCAADVGLLLLEPVIELERKAVRRERRSTPGVEFISMEAPRSDTILDSSRTLGRSSGVQSELILREHAVRTPAKTQTAAKSITPAACDIDRMGHVNNSVYLRWIEQAVHDDWEGLAMPSEFASLLWVAVRHEVDYRRPAFLGDVLEISVRLDEVRRARAWYDAVIHREGEILVQARSCWCCIEAESRRLTMIPRDTAKRIFAAHAARTSFAEF